MCPFCQADSKLPRRAENACDRCFERVNSRYEWAVQEMGWSRRSAEDFSVNFINYPPITPQLQTI